MLAGGDAVVPGDGPGGRVVLLVAGVYLVNR